MNDGRFVFITARPTINCGIVTHVIVHVLNYWGSGELPTIIMLVQTHYFPFINKGKPFSFGDLGALFTVILPEYT